jgi:hypothetical protein
VGLQIGCAAIVVLAHQMREKTAREGFLQWHNAHAPDPAAIPIAPANYVPSLAEATAEYAEMRATIGRKLIWVVMATVEVGASIWVADCLRLLSKQQDLLSSFNLPLHAGGTAMSVK